MRAACSLSCLELFGSSFYFFLTLTTPAGAIKYIQSFAENALLIVTQIHPFTAAIDSVVMSMRWTICLFSLRLGVLLKGKLMGVVEDRERESITCSRYGPLKNEKLTSLTSRLHLPEIEE